ncbi:DUF4153 domain-containing protein [Chryseobacterium taklimakanense]|uniref:DUF4153 domain-containing protein n=1 Tax=Chryseobacterium taklimakanense TaxID=536441 RepID=UPI001E29B3EB|nr:DUF4173 domain-containing protein [Chryseobacterium taklimakanense]
MKTFQKILLATVLFTVLFYDENIGLNFGVLGISYSLILLVSIPKKLRTRTFFVLFIMSVFSSAAFAWYGDFASFVATIMSVALLSFKAKSKELKSVFVIPVFAITFFSFIYRIFLFDRWLPKINTQSSSQKVLAVVVIPAVLLSVFFAIYTLGSDHFANILNFNWNLNIWLLLVMICLGFFFAFNFFNLWIPGFLHSQNHFLKNYFTQEDRIAKPTYSFMDLDTERTSGLVSLVVLNILLVFFIITYNYEQFYENMKTPVQLSRETHERVNAVILSIIMAIVVLMFYFKSNFNFDEKAKPLKTAAKIWIVLNGVLVCSAILKNLEYFVSYGVTYKRLGVFAFLVLCLIGLVLTFIKVQQRKTNAFLINHMVWYFYGTVLAASWINWGNMATVYNINNDKADFYYLSTLNFNDEILMKHYSQKMKESYNTMRSEKKGSKLFYRKNSTTNF